MVKSLIENSELFQQIASRVQIRRQMTSDDILLAEGKKSRTRDEENIESPTRREEILSRAKNCMNAIARARHLLKDPARTPIHPGERVQAGSKSIPKSNSNVLRLAKLSPAEDSAHTFTFSNGFFKHPDNTKTETKTSLKGNGPTDQGADRVTGSPDRLSLNKGEDSPVKMGVAGTRRLKGYSRPRVAFTPGLSQMFFGPLDGTVSTGQLYYDP